MIKVDQGLIPISVRASFWVSVCTESCFHSGVLPPAALPSSSSSTLLSVSQWRQEEMRGRGRMRSGVSKSRFVPVSVFWI